MSEPVLFQFNKIVGGYGSMTVLRNLSGSVKKGQCLGVLGRNGVGKSTLLKLLAGHLKLSAGNTELLEQDVTGLSPDERQAKGMSYAPQERPVFDSLSIRDNLALMRPTASLDVYQPYFDAFPVLSKRLSQIAGTLSGGERKILSFVRALAEAGAITLLDEPTEGVQPENIEHMQRFILNAKSAGRGFIVVEQHLHTAKAISDDYLIMDHGECVLAGRASDISRDTILEKTSV